MNMDLCCVYMYIHAYTNKCLPTFNIPTDVHIYVSMYICTKVVQHNVYSDIIEF